MTRGPRKASRADIRRGLAVRLLEARIAAKKTQEQLAGLLGVSTACVCQWEKGVTAPGVSRMPEVARVLGVTVGELYGETPSAPIDEAIAS